MEGSKENPIQLPEVIITPSFQFDFEKAESGIFKTPLSNLQKASIVGIFTEMQIHGVKLLTQAAYFLATAYHETAGTMLPIHEYGSDKYLSKYDTGKLAVELGNTPTADSDGQLYAGRGYVMITGRSNYEKFSSLTGLDLIKAPDLALDPYVASFIMVYGMLNGTFTGKKLSTYIHSGLTDYQNARRTVNGLDKAPLIASYASQFIKYIS